ncbi:glycoside hydrolase, partial [Streptomyces sp. RSD-27]
MSTGCLAVALAGVLVAAGPPPAARAEPVGELLTRLQGLYQKAEEATEAYNASEVALKARQAEGERLSSALGRARSALDSERATAGRLAREQYQGAQGGGLSPYLRMLLSGDPGQALDQR